MEALVEYNYEAQEPDELTIQTGDVIKDIKVLNGGWWEGTLGDKRGMFPDNFVKVLETQGSTRNSGERNSKNEEVTLRNGSGRRYCKVLFSYEPCNDDELKLLPEESIEYLGVVEEGWWRGCLKGKVGVFPSNFVSLPAPEETERNKDKKELCRVKYPYEAANEDELTLVEGDIITLLSRDALDKGWWKGELKGQIGLFPDNFVEVITVKSEQVSENQVDQGIASKLLTKQSTGKRKETANIRKSLDTRNIRTDSTTATVVPSLKKITSSSSPSLLSGSSIEKKSANALISSLKRLVGDNTSINTNNNNNSNNGNGSAATGLGEELDEVERGEGAPLSHLTASRAKAPRRRLPSTQHLRHNATITTTSGTNNISATVEDNMTNGSAEISEVSKDDENDGLVTKSRRKAPWVEELKLNQMERKKIGTDWLEKGESKKDRVFSWLTSPVNSPDSPKPDLDGEEFKSKEKEKEKSYLGETTPLSEQTTTASISSFPAYVPYHLYSQLLDRVAVLEEKQNVLQRKVNQLTEQLATVVFNASNDKD